MKYITHNRFKKLAACGEAVNIPYGTEMETAGDFIITTEGKPICYATSEAAKMHFARNDDGQGLERGKLTWAIAYSQRVRPGQRGAECLPQLQHRGKQQPDKIKRSIPRSVRRGGSLAAQADEPIFC